jgi:hypothetical protein
MDELLGGPIPHEPRATCSTCPQIDPQLEELAFDPRTKCCTYMPAIYNFLAGRILQDDDPQLAKGRATVEARLDAGTAVTPLGLLATQEYVEEYADDSKFGRAYHLRCPHYLREEGGLCGVWRHREGTCATWYCRHVRGGVAFDFWRRGLSPLLRAAEKSLARWCAEQVGATAVDWGRWEGRPRALFVETSRIVAGMTWKEIEAIGGDEVRDLAHETRSHHQALLGAPYQPASPKLAPFDLQSDDGVRARIATYTPFDPLEIPSALLRELHRFDARPRAQAIADIKSRGLALGDELMQRLSDWRLIVEEGDGNLWVEG